jgi:SAM-dependent methyltransferase
LKAKQLETTEPSPKQFKEPDAEESPMKPRLSIKESLKKCSEESPKSETKPKTNSKWETFPVAQWQDAVYTNRAYFGQLCIDTSNFITNIAETIKLSGSRVSLVEVGCGTGEFVRDIAGNFRVAVGLDFNPMFIEYCSQQVPKSRQDQERYVRGDATKLVEEMEQHFPKKDGLLWNDTRIVACVGNTIGIIPQEMKAKVYEQMLELAGENGLVIMTYWSAAWFGDAVQNFYHANPKLCGPFTGDCIDLGTCTLKTPSGYCTHWTSVQEARDVMEGFGHLDQVYAEGRPCCCPKAQEGDVERQMDEQKH